ncbi:hypothetical protein ACQ4PT_011338 [Festuca glaucescens]
MALNSATMASSLRCCPAVAATRGNLRRRADTLSPGLPLPAGHKLNSGIGFKLSCAPPTNWSYAHDLDSDSESVPPLPWWGDELLDEDAEFLPLADLFPVGQGRKELDAIWHALVAGPLESIVLTVREIMAAGNLFRCRSFHAGTLSGALLVVAGFCQLCKLSPALFMDIVLGYIFYKLSILSGKLQRSGRAFYICARIQLVLLLILAFKDNSAFQGFYRFLVEQIWWLNVYLYSTMAYDGVVGVKHSRGYWLGIYRLLRAKGGLMKVLRGTFHDLIEKASVPRHPNARKKYKVPSRRRK